MSRENVFTLRIPDIGYEGSVSVRVVATEKCRIAFDVDSTDYKDGVFGFCEYTSSLKNKLKDKQNKAAALQAEFPPTGLQIEGKDYYSSWVSMRKGQTITLKLDWENKSKLENYTSIAFDAHPSFVFSATDLRDPADQSKKIDEIKITCNAESTTPTRLEIKTNNKTVVGVLNVFHPKPKKVKVRWFVVENNGGIQNNDENEITGQTKHNINLTDLQSDFKKAFNPALIDVDFVNASPIILDITTLPNGLVNHVQKQLTTSQTERNNLKKKLVKYEQDTFKPLEETINGDNAKAWTADEIEEIKKRIKAFRADPTYQSDILRYNEVGKVANQQTTALQMAQNKATIFKASTTDEIDRSDDRKALIELLKSVYALQHNATLEDDTVYLFFTYFKCQAPNTTTGQSGQVQGFTYREQRSCIMFTKNKDAKATFSKDIPHEVMHALDLEHTFETAAQHAFNKSKTDNYMDYDNTAKHTFVWQWRLLHEHKLTV